MLGIGVLKGDIRIPDDSSYARFEVPGFYPYIAISQASRGAEEQQPTPPGRISSGCAEGLGFRAAATQSVPKP